MFAESNDTNSSVLVVESRFIPEEQLQIVKASLSAVYAGSITFEQLGRLDSIPFNPSSYDIILSGTIIPAFPHSPSILNKYAYILRPGGFLHLKELIFIGDPVPAGTQLAPLKTQKEIASGFQLYGFVDIDVNIGPALSDKEVLDFVCRCWYSSTEQVQFFARQLSQQLAVAEIVAKKPPYELEIAANSLSFQASQLPSLNSSIGGLLANDSTVFAERSESLMNDISVGNIEPSPERNDRHFMHNISTPMGIRTRLLWSLLWLAPCVGVAFLAALIESKLIADLCRTEGVSITLALVQTLGAVLATLTVALLWAGIRKYVSQMHSHALIFGEGILFKDLASWPYLSDFPPIVQMFRSGTVGIWLLCTGFIAVSLGTWSRMSYTVDGIVGKVTTASRIDAPEQSLSAGTVCGAGCLAVSSQSVRSRFEGIAASKTMSMSDGFQAPDGFSVFLPPPSSFAAYVRRIKKSGFIGGRIQCNRQTAKPTNVFFSDRYLRDKIFFTASFRALIADIPEPTATPGELNWSATLWQNGGNSTSQDGGSLYGYMVCNVTARIYILTASALPKQDKWDDASITLERDTRLIFTAGNSVNLKPLLPSCPDCGVVGAIDNNYTLALVYGGKVDAIASVQGQYANVGYDGKGVPIPSHAWLNFPYSRLLQNEKDESVFIEKFINRVSVGFSEVNTVPDGISFELETEDRFICVINRWPVVYVQLALAGIVGLVGAYRVLTSKIRLIDIGPMALLAMGATPETARQLYGVSASGEDGMQQHERRIVKVVDATSSNSEDTVHFCLAFADEENHKLL